MSRLNGQLPKLTVLPGLRRFVPDKFVFGVLDYKFAIGVLGLRFYDFGLGTSFGDG